MFWGERYCAFLQDVVEWRYDVAVSCTLYFSAAVV